MVRCLALCWIWVCCAHAADPTQMAVGADSAQVGQLTRVTAVVWTAVVAPHDITGTMAFTSNGAAIPGCASVPLVNKVATCHTSFAHAGTQTLGGAYSGNEWWAAS